LRHVMSPLVIGSKAVVMKFAVASYDVIISLIYSLHSLTATRVSFLLFAGEIPTLSCTDRKMPLFSINEIVRGC